MHSPLEVDGWAGVGGGQARSIFSRQERTVFNAIERIINISFFKKKIFNTLSGSALEREAAVAKTTARRTSRKARERLIFSKLFRLVHPSAE